MIDYNPNKDYNQEMKDWMDSHLGKEFMEQDKKETQELLEAFRKMKDSNNLKDVIINI